MVVFNYTKVKKREKLLYSLFNTTISKSGLAVSTLKTCGILLAIFSVFGVIFCMITDTIWYSPLNFSKGSAAGYFYMVFVITPIVIGVALNSTKIQNYKAIDYLKLYFKPKKPINQNGDKVVLTKYKQETFIERL